MCASARRSSGSESSLRANIDSRARSKPRQQSPQVRRPQRHAAGGGGAIGPGHMHEHGATAAGDARARIMGNLDHQVVELVVAPHPVAWFIGRAPEGTIVAPVGWVLAPCRGAIDAVNREQGVRPRRAVGPPPQPHKPEAPARRRPVALALVGQDAGAPEHDGNRAPARQQNSVASAGWPAAHAKERKDQSPHWLKKCARSPTAIHHWPKSCVKSCVKSCLKSCLLFWPRMLYFAPIVHSRPATDVEHP
jgi:hypothetical protein